VKRSLVARLTSKNLHTWVRGYLRSLARRRPRWTSGPRHLLFAFCDHYEPLWGKVPRDQGEARVRYWRQHYPEMARAFRDADGRPPQHSFFFPSEEFDDRFFVPLTELCRHGLGEVELHLHHDRDSADNLRRNITGALETYARYGHFSRDAQGRVRYGFIHGNWCLANARADGRWCGVDEELPLLFDTGCYADFTFPSAPDECQPDMVNAIYWPQGDLARKRSYERGELARVGREHRDRLLMITGPLALSRRPGSVSMRIESSAVTASDPATFARVRSWVDQAITIDGRPDWVFVKVHTHGAPEAQAASLLGEGGAAMHRALSSYNDGVRWKLHYVTAREMYNLAIAAMRGASGDPNQHRDAVLPPPPVRQHGNAD